MLEPGLQCERFLLIGQVPGLAFRPVAGALLDVWLTAARGWYGTIGLVLRGHEFADVQGCYWLQPLVPAKYPGRTHHIHFHDAGSWQECADDASPQHEWPGEPTQRPLQGETVTARMHRGGNAQGSLDFVLAHRDGCTNQFEIDPTQARAAAAH